MTIGTAIAYLIAVLGAIVGIGGSIWSLRITNRLYPSENKKARTKK
jgi:hypothetical protein